MKNTNNLLLFIAILEKKPSRTNDFQRKERKIVCMAPDQTDLYRTFAETYMQFYWCSDYKLHLGDQQILAELYIYFNQHGIVEEYMSWYADMLQNILMYHTSPRSKYITYNAVDKYVLTVLKRYDVLLKALQDHKKHFLTIITQVSISIYEILCNVMGFKIHKPVLNSENTVVENLN